MCDKALLNRILNDFTVRVKKQFGSELKEVILYGSYARGDYDEESDVDIAIMLDITHEAASSSYYRKPVVDILYEIDQEYGYAVLLSPVILSFSFFNDWKGAMPFYQNIERDGVILNA